MKFSIKDNYYEYEDEQYIIIEVGNEVFIRLNKSTDYFCFYCGSHTTMYVFEVGGCVMTFACTHCNTAQNFIG